MKIYNREEFLKLPEGVIFFRLIMDEINEEFEIQSANIKMENKIGRFDNHEIIFFPIFDSPEDCVENKSSFYNAIELLNKGREWSDPEIRQLISGQIELKNNWWKRENKEDSGILYLVIEKSDWEKIKSLVDKAYK